MDDKRESARVCESDDTRTVYKIHLGKEAREGKRAAYF